MRASIIGIFMNMSNRHEIFKFRGSLILYSLVHKIKLTSLINYRVERATILFSNLIKNLKY